MTNDDRTDAELIASARRLMTLTERREVRADRAVAGLLALALALSRDVIRLAELLPPEDELEAAEVAGAVRRARLVLARFAGTGVAQ
jgi:hypothetical protein